MEGYRARGRLPLTHPERIGYRDQKLWRREESYAMKHNVKKIRCPCNKCKCCRLVKLIHVHRHLIDHGRYYLTRIWRNRDEWDSSDGEWDEAERDDVERAINLNIANRSEGENISMGADADIHNLPESVIESEPIPFDCGIEIERMISEAFHVVDSFSNIPAPGAEDPDHPDQPFEMGETRVSGEYEQDDAAKDDHEEHAKALKDACAPLYDGSNISKISFTMVVMSIFATHGCPNVALDEMLAFLRKTVLPEKNHAPESHGQAKGLINRLGLNYVSIHACVSGCVLFRGEHSEHTKCPKCGEDRYKRVGKCLQPRKVLRHFPIIPRLKRMYQCKAIAELMTWSAEHKSTDGLVRHTADSKQWQEIDRLWPDFARDGRNVRFGLALDGVNPFSEKSTVWSTWPVLLLNYNLPPWLVTKKFFIQLVLLIPGPESVTGCNIDIYLAPLVEELQVLWTGVLACDISRPTGEQSFCLRAMLIWTINDYPALGTISGQSTYGKVGCVCCGSRVVSEYSNVLHKPLYRGHRRYLPDRHPYRERRYDAAFDRQADGGEHPGRFSSEEILESVVAKTEYESNGGTDGGVEDPAKISGVKRFSIFFTLPYWKGLLVRHLLDVMHCEKNLSANLLKTLFGEKDSLNSRRDMESRGVRPHLWLRPHPRRPDVSVKPMALYVLTTEEQKIVTDRLRNVKVPSGYSAAWKKHILKKKLGNMKSHDYHILIHQILPYCLRGLMAPEIRNIINRVSRIFRRLCAKVWDPNDYQSLTEDVAITMCMLEMHFPPSFFDVMTHLLVHLVEEIDIAGPVATRWMYPVERYLGTLKRYVRSKSRPEGGMAEGYIKDEALGYITEYMQNFDIVKTRVWDAEEEDGDAGEVLEGKGTRRTLSRIERDAAHEYVLQNTSLLENLFSDYTELRATNKIDESLSFATWIRVRISDHKIAYGDVDKQVFMLAYPPDIQCLSYKRMRAYGNHYRVEDQSITGFVTYDSGVALYTSPSENIQPSYVGIILDILEFNYGNMETPVVLFKCKWIVNDSDSARASMKVDRDGFLLGNFSRILHGTEDVFVFPSQVQQVFFGEAEDSPPWKVVMLKEARSVRQY